MNFSRINYSIQFIVPLEFVKNSYYTYNKKIIAKMLIVINIVKFW
jgi:hypothetical protein